MSAGCGSDRLDSVWPSSRVRTEVVSRIGSDAIPWQCNRLTHLHLADDGHNHHSNAYEVESNGSIAPSQSASQVGYNSDGEQDRRQRSHGRGGHVPGMAGSVTGSIAEEDENSSSDDDENLVVHENKRPGAGTGGNDLRSRSQTTIVPSGNAQNGGQGVPSITNIKAKPATRRQHSGSSGSSVARGPGRRTQSELGYNPPRARQNRMSIRRAPSRGAMSDASSDRSVGRRGGGKKKGGFFASIAKIFKGKSSGGSIAGSTRGGRRGGADSPPLTQRNTGGWSTRTDDNIRRAVSNAGTGRGMSGGRKSRNADYSSSDDEMGGGNLVAVTNRGNNTWSVDNAGRKNGSTPAAPAAASAGKTRKSRSDLGAGERGRTSSQNTVTQTTGKVTSKPPGVASQPVTRSNTVKSTSSGVGSGSQRTRHGSITRVGARGSTMGAPPSIAGVLEGVVPKAPSSATAASSKPAQNRASEIPKAPGSSIVPRMADVPKAPSSQVTPKMYMATAPPPNKAPLLQPPPAQMSNSASAPVGLSDGYVPKAAASSVSKASKASKATITPKTAQQAQQQPQQQQQQQQQAPPQATQVTKSSSALANLNLGAPVGMSQANASVDSITARASTPLPPSKTLSPPAKSAMRASSPVPLGSPEFEAPPPAFMISAPGSVIKEKPQQEEAPVVLPQATVPSPQPQARAERPSTPATMTDADSVYESAVEEDAHTDDERQVTGSQPLASNGIAEDDDDGSSVASDSTAGPGQSSKYKVIENTEGPAAKLRQAGAASTAPATTSPAAPAPVQAAPEKPKEVAKEEYVTPAAASVTGSALERRKSVRMNVPPSPGTPTTTAPPDSPTPEGKRDSSTWSSRIGRTADSSDEEDNAAYAKARRSMNRYSSLSASKPAATTTTSTTTTKKKKKSTKA